MNSFLYFLLIPCVVKMNDIVVIILFSSYMLTFCVHVIRNRCFERLCDCEGANAKRIESVKMVFDFLIYLYLIKYIYYILFIRFDHLNTKETKEEEKNRFSFLTLYLYLFILLRNNV